MFEVNSRDTRTTSFKAFDTVLVSLVNFEHISQPILVFLLFATIIYKCLLFSVISVERKNHVIYKFNILFMQLKISFDVNLTTYSDKKKRQFKQDLPIILTA